MWDCWHTQLRLVAAHFPEVRLRPLRCKQTARYGSVFVYVSATVDRRETRCPPDVVQWFKELGYTIIHIQEPRE